MPARIPRTRRRRLRRYSQTFCFGHLAHDHTFLHSCDILADLCDELHEIELADPLQRVVRPHQDMMIAPFTSTICTGARATRPKRGAPFP